jgi:hypothetical protein
MSLDKELEAKMSAPVWKGSSDAIWSRIENQIHARQQRSRRLNKIVSAGAVAAVLALFVGVRLFSPTGATTPPPITAEHPGDRTVYPAPSEETGRPLYTTLQGFLARQQHAFLGEVESVEDISLTPPDLHPGSSVLPQEHPKAGDTAAPSASVPAKRYKIKITRVFKGADLKAGSTMEIQQLNVSYTDGVDEPLLEQGKSYLLFPRLSDNAALDLTNAPFVAIDADGRLQLTHPRYKNKDYLRDLPGLTLDEAIQRIESLTAAP